MAESSGDILEGDRVLVFSRTIDAPRELVWRVWTTPECVAEWWGPPGCANYDCEIDLRMGGEFRLNMQVPNGETYPCTGRFKEIDPPHRFVLEGDGEDDHPCGAGIPPGSLVILTLEEAGDQTVLKLETQFPSATAQKAANEAGYSTSWSPCLDRMEAFIAAQ